MRFAAAVPLSFCILLCSRLMVIAGQPSLSDQVRGLVWEWLVHWPWESTAGEDGLPDRDTLNHSQEYGTELKKSTLKTSVFDSNGERGCQYMVIVLMMRK